MLSILSNRTQAFRLPQEKTRPGLQNSADCDKIRAMETVLDIYPSVPWAAGWHLRAAAADNRPLITGPETGTLTAPGAQWTLRTTDPAAGFSTRLLSNGFSVRARRRPRENRMDALLSEPGILCGCVHGLPAPSLVADGPVSAENDFSWIQHGAHTALLLLRGNRFVFVYGSMNPARAMDCAETGMQESFDSFLQQETDRRARIQRLLSINPRHNPPVALAAETLIGRLRERTASIHGLWSCAEGFDVETFSLNELYPLVRAWVLINPDIAMDLVETALSLQQPSGDIPAWVDRGGRVSTAAAWPLPAQAFEHAWQVRRDPDRLRKHLPALRKYIQRALRRFDPHRDRIPAWQSEQELLIPGPFERGRATPELTVLLITEIDAVVRLCEQSETTPPPPALLEERSQLIRTLDTVFWNPAEKAFSNTWKDGHYKHDPSFGSFLPLLRHDLDADRKNLLIERFEETRRFPGQSAGGNWKQEQTGTTARLPTVHQFLALEALHRSGAVPLRFFVQQIREHVTAWFEQQSLAAARHRESADGSVYDPGPVTAALILAAQDLFEREAARAPSAARLLHQWVHRLRFNRTDLTILVTILIAAMLIHLAYTLPRRADAEERMAEALLDYRQGRLREAMTVCRRFPEHPVSRFVRANLLLLTEEPERAAELYRQVLLQHPDSASALLGLALSRQMSGHLEQAEKRYVDFLDLYEKIHPEAAALANEFLLLTQEGFQTPPRWRRLPALPLMADPGF